MSRIHRASIAAAFGYARFGLALTAGLIVVPFVLHHLGARVYGFWLATGEVLAYAAMADFGLLGVLPWLIAEADGRRDRAGIRSLLCNGAVAALGLTVLYAVLVLLLWNVLPAVLRLTAVDRAAVVGPFLLIAAGGALALPLRIFSGALGGLQDVRFQGTLSTSAWAADVLLTVILLRQGYGLYALAIAAAVPGFVSAAVSLVRMRLIAPDLLRDWPRPSVATVTRLFRESIGGWFGQWGWRLTAATDSIILAALGSPTAVTVLACTSKLGAMVMHMSWLPGDSALIGLANLHGERQAARLRDAVLALLRVYIALAGAAVCVVLAANPGFVTRWVGADLFAGDQVNGMLAVALMVTSIGHAMSVVTSVLGRRIQVGAATLMSGIVQVALAVALGSRIGVLGVVLASILAQGLVLIPLVAGSFAAKTGVSPRDAIREVALPLLVRSGPLSVAALAAGLWMPAPPLWGVVLIGVVTATGYLWITRPVFLGYPPVQALLDRMPSWGMPAALRRRLETRL
jgi:O-antigen/teichoic acid export membrane protein